MFDIRPLKIEDIDLIMPHIKVYFDDANAMAKTKRNWNFHFTKELTSKCIRSGVALGAYTQNELDGVIIYWIGPVPGEETQTIATEVCWHTNPDLPTRSRLIMLKQLLREAEEKLKEKLVQSCIIGVGLENPLKKVLLADDYKIQDIIFRKELV